MTKESVFCAFVLALASAAFLAMAPGVLSLVFVALAVVVCVVAFVFGIYRVCDINRGVCAGNAEVDRVKSVFTEDGWLSIRQVPSVFRESVLDHAFQRYQKDVEAARAEEWMALPDVEDYINEDLAALRTWRGVILQVPGVLTGIGILGTFVGLIVGVGGVGFSSVTAAINGVESLLGGIEIAFYTSIAGLSLSILFNLMYRVVWNMMLGNMDRFVANFHQTVIPSAAQQERVNASAYQKRVIQLLESAGLGEEKAAAEVVAVSDPEPEEKTTAPAHAKPEIPANEEEADA